MLLLVALGDIDEHLVAIVQDHHSEQGSQTGEARKGRTESQGGEARGGVRERGGERRGTGREWEGR